MKQKVYAPFRADQVIALQKRDAELSADCESIRNAFNEAICLMVTALVEPGQITDKEIADFRDLERRTPRQNLRAVEANAIESALNSVQSCVAENDVGVGDDVVLVKDLERHIEKLRKQPTGGKIRNQQEVKYAINRCSQVAKK